MDSNAPKPARNGTVIGKTAVFKGEIIGNEELTVEGKVEGKVSLESRVYVEQSGAVQADISSHSITVAGSVSGNIVATDKAEILAGGTVVGDIKAPRVVINDGARILGKIEMDVTKPAETKAYSYSSTSATPSTSSESSSTSGGEENKGGFEGFLRRKA